MAANSDEILHDFSPLLRAYKDGRIERLTGQEFVPASVDSTTAVHSKDVEISPEINLSARLFLPENAGRSKKLPLLLFFHGGGFVIESAFSPLYHKHLNFLVAEAKVVAISVNYRLAPEFPLPTAFDDSWLALKWVSSQFTENGGEDWIKDYADINRVYIGGDSAGGNIAHTVAMRVGSEKVDGINLCGIFLNCPFFGGEDPIGVEAIDPFKNGKSFADKLWRFACPSISGCDEPWINPGKDPNISGLGCKKVLIYVAENDFLKERGWYYKEILSKSGWVGEVECVEIAGEVHVFSVFFPESENGMSMLKKVASFINGE